MAFNGIRSRGGGGGAPLGAIIAVPSGTPMEEGDGWLPCDGEHDMSGTDLCKANPSMCGMTPDLNKGKRFLQGTNGTSGTVEAGLPNIKGYYYTPYYYSPYWRGISWEGGVSRKKTEFLEETK